MKNEKIIGIDLGDGALDVTIMEFGGVFNVQFTSGDTHLGGADMDNMLIKYLADEFKDNTGIDLLSDEQAERRFREATERTKIELSSTIESHVNLPFIALDNYSNPGKHTRIPIVQQFVEEYLGKPVEREVNPIECVARGAAIFGEMIYG